MKKFLTIALAAVAFVSLLPAAQAGKPKQTVEGTILFPAPFAQGTFDGCWGGLTRRTTGMTGGAVNGVTGYYFDVDKATWNKKFKLEPTGGQGTVDLDIFLYSVYPGPEANAEDPPNGVVNGGTPVSVDYTTREAGGESGKIPPNTTKAIVCMYAGPEYQGFDAGFTYTAG
jgi:hypothetical protein